MRTLRILPMLIVFIMASQNSIAQDDILGALSEAAKALEESRNEAGESADNSAEESSENAWREAWDKKREENAIILEAMNTKYLKCLALMILYLDSYIPLVEEHRIGELQIPVCDAYNMQAMALATSTTIMYCPESIAELSNEEQLEIVNQYIDILATLSNGEDNQAYKLQMKFLSLILGVTASANLEESNEDLSREEREELEGITPRGGISDDSHLLVLKHILAFFHPKYILSRTLKIAEEREERGCNS